jgi:tetratricopeptide (TPR) repeat protein
LNPSEIKLFNEAKKAAQSKDFTKSIKKFEQLLKTKPAFVEGILRLASNYHSAGQADKAETLFKSAIEKEPEFDPEMYYSLALIQMAQKKFKEAAQQFDTYISKVKTATEKTKKAKSLSDEMKFKDYAFKHQVPFKPIRLSEAINTRYSEYSPSLALDGSGMIFTRNTGQEDFFISMRDTINTFGASLPLFELNTPQNEGAHAISADGKMIVYTACDRRDTYGSCDLSIWVKRSTVLPGILNRLCRQMGG